MNYQIYINTIYFSCECKNRRLSDKHDYDLLKCVFTNLRIRSDGDFWFGEARYMYPWGPLRYHPDTQNHVQSTVLDEHLRFKKNLAKKIALDTKLEQFYVRLCVSGKSFQ